MLAHINAGHNISYGRKHRDDPTFEDQPNREDQPINDKSYATVKRMILQPHDPSEQKRQSMAAP